MSVLLAARLILLGDCTVTGTTIVAPVARTKLTLWLPLLALPGRLKVYPLKLPAPTATPPTSSVVPFRHDVAAARAPAAARRGDRRPRVVIRPVGQGHGRRRTAEYGEAGPA